MSQRTDAIAEYMMGKGAKIDNGSYDEMIVVWDKLLSRFPDDLLVKMCAVAVEEPGRMGIDHIVKSTEGFVDMHFKMKGQQ